MLTTIAKHHKESCISSENAVAWPQTCFSSLNFTFPTKRLIASSIFISCVQNSANFLFNHELHSFWNLDGVLVVKNRDAWSVHTLQKVVISCVDYSQTSISPKNPPKTNHSLNFYSLVLNMIIILSIAWWYIMNCEKVRSLMNDSKIMNEHATTRFNCIMICTKKFNIIHNYYCLDCMTCLLEVVGSSFVLVSLWEVLSHGISCSYFHV